MNGSAVVYQIMEVQGLGGLVEAFQVSAPEEVEVTDEELRSAAIADMFLALLKDEFPNSLLAEVFHALVEEEKDSHSVGNGAIHVHFVVRLDVDNPYDETVIQGLIDEFAPSIGKAHFATPVTGN